MSFFPVADAAVLAPGQRTPPPRPTVVAPIYDPDHVDSPIESWDPCVEACAYPDKAAPYAPAAIPEPPACPSSRYLRAHLAKNERLRLSMLWYYTRGVLDERDFLVGLQEKACLAQEATGWEFVVIGILDVNLYIRLATVGLQLAVLPRGETLCAHTVTQPPGSVFLLPNMMEDWRFQDSPYVEHGGLTAYAGVPLRMQNASGECVGLGSLCVASATSQDPLPKSQQQTLARLADCIVSDIVQCARARRQRERHRMSELIAEVQNATADTESEEPVLRLLRVAYPDATVSLQSSRANHIDVEGRDPLPLSDLESGLWEDVAYFDQFITSSNHQDPPRERVIRVIAAQCENMSGPSLLLVATKDFRLIFDDVDSWFVETCASMLTLRWQKRLLAEVTRTKEKFLRGISHSLRTPIHGILGAAELLAEDLRANDLREIAHKESALMERVQAAVGATPSAYLDTITTAGRNLISIVNSMITLNRWADIATADRQHALHNIYDLETQLTDGMLEAISGSTPNKTSVFFKYDLPPGYDSLRIDIGLLRDSLLPLVVNGIQNTPEGIVVVTIATSKDHKELIVDVEDTGCGIRPDDQNRIFELYEKVDVHSTGAGLGLTLATKFATLLDGSVELVSSNIDRGSHFRAIFRKVDFIDSSISSQAVGSALRNIPSSFHHMRFDSKDMSLSEHLINCLTRNGLYPSDSPHSCILLLDFVPDVEERRIYLSKILSGQVAICPIPATEERELLERSRDNVIYVRGPLFTSSMRSALEEADRLMAAMNDPQEHLLTSDVSLPTNSKNDEGFSSDEGYGSTGDSLSPNEERDPLYDDVTEPKPETVPTSLLQLDGTDPVDSKTTIPAWPVPTTGAKPKALLVDDNIINLRIMQMYCRKRGLPYCCATNGRQAVEMFSQQQSLAAAGKETPIELILMDLQMPVCDGIEATEQIRALERKSNWQASVLFIVTGQDGPLDRAAADTAGADEFLVKPVGIKLLDRGLEQCFPAFKVT